MSRMLLCTTGSYAFGSMVAVEWTQQPYRLCRMPVEDHHALVHLAINPTGAVPSLVLDTGVRTDFCVLARRLTLSYCQTEKPLCTANA